MTGIVRKYMEFCDFLWNDMSKMYDSDDRRAEVRHQNRTGEKKKRCCSGGAVYKTALISAIATTALLTARSFANCYSEANSLTCVQLDYLFRACLIVQFGAASILVMRY
jgi:hypothetical protein